MTADLRLGKWEDVLRDVEPDCLLADPPFGARTHAAVGRRKPGSVGRAKSKIEIDFPCWTTADVSAFVDAWSHRVRGWLVALTSHDLISAWQDALDAAGRYSFAPVPCIVPGGSIRLQGDGPSQWAVYAMVARPKSKRFASWGTLSGAYVCGRPSGGNKAGGTGRGKPLDLMRALVKDYSRPGDLICDPCAGYGTTGIAALGMGRRFVGAECDPNAHAEGLRRLARVVPVELPGYERARQEDLL